MEPRLWCRTLRLSRSAKGPSIADYTRLNLTPAALSSLTTNHRPLLYSASQFPVNHTFQILDLLDFLPDPLGRRLCSKTSQQRFARVFTFDRGQADGLVFNCAGAGFANTSHPRNHRLLINGMRAVRGLSQLFTCTFDNISSRPIPA
jgi:hypothetical protein